MASNDIRMRVLLNVEGKTAVAEVTSSVKELQEALGTAKSKADKFRLLSATLSNVSTLGRNAIGAIQGLGAAMQPLIDKANSASVAQTKLKTVMEQRMRATPEDVAGINKLVAAQSRLGVIGGTVQRSGLQQVATFSSQRSTLETLLPAMNNLIAQQKGLNATSEDAVAIANMMGKALMGNAGAMTRVGITLTESQKKIIQTGTEGERAAAIAQAINENVGQMNRRLAETDAGRVKQMANEFGGFQVTIGKFFAKYQDVIAGVGQVGMAIGGIATLGSAIMGLSRALGLTTLASKAFAVAQVSFSAMGNLVTAAIQGQTISLAALRVGIKGTIASLGIVGIAYLALSTILEAVADKMGLLGDKATGASEAMSGMTSAQREAASQAARTKKAGQLTAEAVGEVEGKFRTLQAEWKRLRTAADQTKWIKKNQGAFSELGLSIGDVNAAQRVFVTNAPKVVEALKAIAEADAYKEEYGKAKVAETKAEANRSVRTGSYYVKAKSGQHTTQAEMEAAGLGNGDFTSRGTASYARDDFFGRKDNTAKEYYLTESGARKVNALRERSARDRRNAYLSPYQEASSFWGGKMGEALDRAANAREFLDGIGSVYGGADASLRPRRGHAVSGSAGGRAGGGNAGRADDRPEAEKAYNERRERIDRLSYEFAGTEDVGRRKEIAGEISRLKAQNAEVDALRKLAMGEGGPPTVEAPERQRTPWRGAATSGRLTQDTIDAWTANARQELSATDLSTSGGMDRAMKITADLSSVETLENTIQEALANGLVLPEDAVQGLFGSIFDAGNVPSDKIDEWVAAVNSELESKGLGKIEMHTDSKGVSKLVSGGKEAKSSWKDAARAVQSVGGALSGIEDPAVKIAGTIAQAIAEIALSFASALNRKESMAGGVWGWIAAAAAGTATMISTIAAIKGATRHAGGGIVGGNTPSGDLQPVLLNSGELILNKAQQGALASQMQERRGTDTARQPYVTGEEIYLGLSNYLRRRGYGEIVTTGR